RRLRCHPGRAVSASRRNVETARTCRRGGELSRPLLQEARRALSVALRLEAAAEELGKERLRGGGEDEVVLGPGKPMSFVGKHDVDDVASIVPHGRDDLIALSLFHAHVVRT